MKLLAIALLAFVLGFLGGATLGGHVLVQWLHKDAITFDAQERLRASVSLRALDDLQAGQVDRAKSWLAQQVALYYHTMQQLDTLPEKQKLVAHIEASSKTSPELKNALSEKSQ
jgi:hypothetical protein